MKTELDKMAAVRKIDEQIFTWIRSEQPAMVLRVLGLCPSMVPSRKKLRAWFYDRLPFLVREDLRDMWTRNRNAFSWCMTKTPISHQVEGRSVATP